MTLLMLLTTFLRLSMLQVAARTRRTLSDISGRYEKLLEKMAHFQNAKKNQAKSDDQKEEEEESESDESGSDEEEEEEGSSEEEEEEE